MNLVNLNTNLSFSLKVFKEILPIYIKSENVEE